MLRILTDAYSCILLLFLLFRHAQTSALSAQSHNARTRIDINSDWKFRRWESNPDEIIYDHRPDLVNLTNVIVLKSWILPSGNEFISDPSKRHIRPAGSPPGGNITFVQNTFDDSTWETVNVPHDWAISGPFYTEPDDVAIVGGGMGRLPVFGVGWYRRNLPISSDDRNKRIFLEVDGAMSYAMVWLNGHLVGGWPYPYNSFQLDLTPYVRFGEENLLAVRLDNPVESARWYPGGGIYRNMWITKVAKTSIGQWGVKIEARDVGDEDAMIDLVVSLENQGEDTTVGLTVSTEIYELDVKTEELGKMVVQSFGKTEVGQSGKAKAMQSIKVQSPRLWGPPPTQTPHLYAAVTRLFDDEGDLLDSVQNSFGIRNLEFTGDNGLWVNGERIQIQGVNEHHNLGALGAAFNIRAAERKLEILQEMGTDAIRMAHNPPAKELLDLTDRMGFLVVDEVFDSWRRNKTDNDFHLIFDDWHEQDLRAMIRRDGNHPSIIAWSIGNEVGEQMHSVKLAEIASTLHEIVREEDPTRPSTASMNYAQPGNEGAPMSDILDVLSINYQGEGIRDSPNYNVTSGISTPPAYSFFHESQPENFIWTSESASTLSTRGTYTFPVVDNGGAPVNETSGGNASLSEVSAYELYSANFGSSPDKVFLTQDLNPYVAGEFVWTGFDYIGEPTPYYNARSSYSGIVDLAGFKKDRFYLYQARWRPELPVAHLLPHWNWMERIGEVTPVHLFTNCDEAELFLNDKSLEKKLRGDSEYRIRWDDVVYEPGELRILSWKNGQPWANASIKTTGPPIALRLSADRQSISADGLDLVFVTVEAVDVNGLVVPTADCEIHFSTSDNAQIVATDNGYPADLVPFPSRTRKLFNGKALGIVKASRESGTMRITVSSDGLEKAEVWVEALPWDC